MQTLEERNTYTPTNPSQVRSNCDLELNRGYALREPDLKTFSNNSDVNQPQHTGGLKGESYVFILNKDNQPLMPCTPTKARHLLKAGKAKVIKRMPFTIQLLSDYENNVQPVTLGLDSGYSHIGFSATSQLKELLSGELILKNDIPKKLKERAMYRRNRRSRNTWYREPGQKNWKIREGWFAPSIEHKLQTHIRLVDRIKKLLPISDIIVEVATFDTQKMVNPEISGIEYQQGTLRGYEIREYELEKWKRKCAYCKKSNIPLQLEHIVPKSRGGSNRVSNLTVSCGTCNQLKGNKTAKEFGYPNIQKQALKPLKEAAFMNIVRKRLVDELKCKSTYGYVTKHNRIKLGIEKSHVNDAFVIAGGSSQIRAMLLKATQTRRNNRSLQIMRNGYAPAIRKHRYPFQPNDLVEYKGSAHKVSGTHCGGKRVQIHYNDGIKSLATQKLRLITYGKGIQFEYGNVTPPIQEVYKGV